MIYVARMIRSSSRFRDACFPETNSRALMGTRETEPPARPGQVRALHAAAAESLTLAAGGRHSLHGWIGRTRLLIACDN